MDELARRFGALRSPAPFWSLRGHEETHEVLSVRQDTVEPPRLSLDRGAMLTALTEGGYGYCATSDLSVAGLQKALDRATEWALATQGASVVRFEPATMPAPRGEYRSPVLEQDFHRGEEDGIGRLLAALELFPHPAERRLRARADADPMAFLEEGPCDLAVAADVDGMLMGTGYRITEEAVEVIRLASTPQAAGVLFDRADTYERLAPYLNGWPRLAAPGWFAALPWGVRPGILRPGRGFLLQYQRFVTPVLPWNRPT